MENRFLFRAGFKVCYYDKDGNDKELLIKTGHIFTVTNGGEHIIVHRELIMNAIENLSAEERAGVWEYMRANFTEDLDWWIVDNLEYLDRCTGLTDKNGKLMYEGDILTDKIFNYEVVWDNNSGHFGLKALDSIFDIYNETRCAVIGNVHENKELLNKNMNEACDEK